VIPCSQCHAPIAADARVCPYCFADVPRLATDEVTFAQAPYASGERLDGRYTIVQGFGSGPLGTTYQARTDDDRPVAIRVLPHALLPTPPEREAFVAGLLEFRGRPSPRVAAAIHAGFLEECRCAYYVSPWVVGASLRRILRAHHAARRPLTPAQVRGILQGVVQAMREVHAVAPHGAIYPESLEVTADAVVLTDPGVVPLFPPERLARHFIQFPDVLPYLSTEVLAGRRPNLGADLYAFGSLASELLTGDASRACGSGFHVPGAPPAVEQAVRELVGLKVTRRAGAVERLLEGLAHWTPEAVLPAFAPLPAPVTLDRTADEDLGRTVDEDLDATQPGRLGDTIVDDDADEDATRPGTRP
jgi:serine/threonine protein kinase